MSADIHTLAGAYALHALTEEEERLFRRHLAMCADCAAEVAEYERTAALLGAAVEETPPAGMRAAVLGAVEVTPQVRDAAVPSGRRERLAPVILPVAAAFAALALLMGGVIVQQARELRQTRLAQAAQTDALLGVLGAADLQRIAMRGDGVATVLWSPTQRRAVLVAEGLGALPEGKAYQLWLMRDGVPLPSEVFTAAADGRVVAVLRDTPEAFQGAAVTVEAAAGATTPTGPMVLTPA